MQREAVNTLYTLSSAYQNVAANLYEVIAVDNGSSVPIAKTTVESFGENFKYHFYKTTSVSPCEAMNWGINKAKASHVMCMIDGSRMLSPGILKKTLDCIKLYDNPFSYTLNLHLGQWHQNLSNVTLYDQEKEAQLLDSVPWKKKGYQLFQISDLETSQFNFFSCLFESNCFTISKKELLEIRGFDERFVTPGGGLVNRYVFTKFVENPNIQTVSLLGEASFHQMHGGITSNQVSSLERANLFNAEYKKLFNRSREIPNYNPIFYGKITKESKTILPKPAFASYFEKAKQLVAKEEIYESIIVLEEAKQKLPYYWQIINFLGSMYEKIGDLDTAFKNRLLAVQINPSHPILKTNLGKLYLEKREFENALLNLNEAIDNGDERIQPIGFKLIALLSLGRNSEVNQCLDLIKVLKKNKTDVLFLLRNLLKFEQYKMIVQIGDITKEVFGDNDEAEWFLKKAKEHLNKTKK